MIVSNGDPTWRIPGLGSEDAAVILGMTRYHSRYGLRKEIATKLVQLDQTGNEWLSWRHQGIGASDASTVMQMNPWKARQDLLDEKVGEIPENGENEHTRRGRLLEPEARSRYETLMGYRMLPVCAIHDEYPFIRASLDGIRDDHRLILEIKCPSKRWHDHTLEHGIPDWYMAQVQHQLLVTGVDQAHFVTYRPSSSPALKIVPVKADPEFQAILLSELIRFWNEVQEERSRLTS